MIVLVLLVVGAGCTCVVDGCSITLLVCLLLRCSGAAFPPASMVLLPSASPLRGTACLVLYPPVGQCCSLQSSIGVVLQVLLSKNRKLKPIILFKLLDRIS